MVPTGNKHYYFLDRQVVRIILEQVDRLQRAFDGDAFEAVDDSANDSSSP